EEVLELLGGDPPALQISVVEAERPLDQLAEGPSHLPPALPGGALRPDHPKLGHARTPGVGARQVETWVGRRSRTTLLPTAPELTSSPPNPWSTWRVDIPRGSGEGVHGGGRTGFGEALGRPR